MPTEVSKTLNARLYPDLQQGGGLGPALQQALEELGTVLRVHEMDEPFIVYAAVRTAERSSQVMVAAHQRAFHVDFWKQGVQYGGGWVEDLKDVARGIVASHVHLASIHEMGTRFAWFNTNAHACAHEDGPDHFVEEQWHSLQDCLKEMSENHHLVAELLMLVIEVYRRPRLRQLLPFTSLNKLCFSRTTGYPYTRDCPVAYPIEGGKFRVMSADQRVILGEGSAAQVADILVQNLPRNCVPAIHGTAENR
jgi:hypothetical protein